MKACRLYDSTLQEDSTMTNSPKTGATKFEDRKGEHGYSRLEVVGSLAVVSVIVLLMAWAGVALDVL